MTKYCKQAALVAALGLLSLPMAVAQNNQKESRSNKAGNSANRIMSPDSTFVTKAAEGGLAEVQMGQLAQQHASNSEVKQFAQQMVTDHTKVNDELKTIASGENITLPTTMSPKDQAKYNRLSKLNGAAFDKAYMNDMVADHRADISEFRRESEQGNNAQLKNFASKNLPTLEQHLKLAEKAQAAVKNEKK
jgi:putative membrane protein